MLRINTSLLFFLQTAAGLLAQPPSEQRVGPADGGTIVTTGQLVRPAGTIVKFKGRPVDLVLTPDGRTAVAKDNRGLVFVDAGTWTITQELPFSKEKKKEDDNSGGSMHGLAIARDGSQILATSANDRLHIARPAGGQWAIAKSIPLPGPNKDASHPTGIALFADGKRALVCLSRNNAVAVVDLEKGAVTDTIPVGVAPFGIALSTDEATAYVSNWGGRRPVKGDKTGVSSGTNVVIDDRGIAASGTVGKLDLAQKKMVSETAVGLHPAGMVRTADGTRLYVANANSDTVSVLDTATMRTRHTILVRPVADLPFGSATNTVCLSKDDKTLYAANGGNNAVAVIDVAGEPTVRGYIPAGWFPGGIATDGANLYISNIKGEGSRTPDPKKAGFEVYQYTGTIAKVAVPDAATLAGYTKQVLADARVPQVLAALAAKRPGVKPVPVPERAGELSVFEHVVYVIKENRTYDQVLGDLKQGNGEPKFCIFGRDITPNHHALAEEFVLLDNFYCNGVLSADGHSWATEGNVTDHLERAFGGFTRSYTYGDDPLTYSSSGFLWDNALLRGRSVRNYGELVDTKIATKGMKFKDIYEDYVNKTGKAKFDHILAIEPLWQRTCKDYPGWNMDISDQQRVDAFLKELAEAERKGEWANLTFLYLPQDHTSGTSPGSPTPNAHMADNDLALGRAVEAISKSKFWPKTCIFVIEDDPQDGWDHVDGHRSIGLVISPYTKRKAVVSRFYNQTSVIHTMERILGLPPMNQMDAMAPVMSHCFTDTPDFTPYKARPATVPLTQLNPDRKTLRPKELAWADLSLRQDFSKPDRIEDGAMNRILWHAIKGVDTPYPAEWAGAHGRGLKDLKLKHGK